ncbi:hypothetical protein M5119_10680 [Lacticaseibacillus paracasei]|jgi:hypothetical protein|uniref:Uncharacterized protein n=1 Tax=Lacticaseibacillus paracasei subsp. paracasei Lpp41 TaxID=1256208 RepID=A0A829H318_LACPA|nr:hypothetical protein [Lacticaseibacillus paracasei]EPC70202.1 hypothetical protein Lpp41_15431 [Lacticaseibacillus paracasei subsp. paracasei Lpp41]MBU6045392.1 hypothetical protein [Lacticaseibacillus paracasei]MBU6048097.1 hypothetical protein [Lacticaseibacillus paracasei]MCL4970214.1 hypothetical protein [Lacticaseibacillus paracasei]MCL4972861.1 hypothetical protein [Lacticaseibacillus paracasei]
MKNGPYRFMSWLSFMLALASSFLPEKYMKFGFYKTFIFLMLLAILIELWDIADAIREGKQ